MQYAKEYTVDGKQYFSSKAEMDRFYKEIEEEESGKYKSMEHKEVASKFLKIKTGMKFMNLAAHERPAKAHNEVVEEKIDKITKYVGERAVRTERRSEATILCTPVASLLVGRSA